jgi:histone H3/H4
MNQPSLFDVPSKTVDAERLVLYALGEFQARGKVLAERELPLDRLRGAFRRAAEHFQTEELTDEEIARELENIGAKVVRVPSFVAKHPFRVTVKTESAVCAAEFYKQVVSQIEEAKQ